MNELLRRVSIDRQILLICALFSIPVMVALYFIAHGFTKDLDFAVFEIFGDEYQRPLQELLDCIPRHQLAARRVPPGQSRAKDDQVLLEAKIDNAFKNLGAV